VGRRRIALAANISAEQFIGMSGTGFQRRIAIAAYEVMAAVTLVVIGKFLLPTMIERKIFTIPQFLRERLQRRASDLPSPSSGSSYTYLSI
jgi:uncharacterized sodium:solute symporter family permease YidK